MPSEIRPGDHILYRDHKAFGIARVDLVKEGHFTSYPFDPNHKKWARRNRRIARHLVLRKLPRSCNIRKFSDRISALSHQREAKELEARRWFEERVEEIGKAL